MDQAAAYFAGEAAGTLGRLFFLCRTVGQRATGTAEIFDGEETACHPAMMLGARRLSSRTGCDSQRPATRTAGAGGVHAGEKSLPLRVLMDARSTTASANFLVGASCHSLEGAIDAAEAGADYLFFGPVFETPSKVSYGPPQGLAKLGQVCSAVSIPVIAIGGITVENATACRKAGAGGIAAIRLFQGDCDIAEIVAALAGE